MSINLIIVSNEKFNLKEKKFYCDNVAEKTLPDGLNKIFKLEVIARYSRAERAHKLDFKNIILCKSLISYLLEIKKKIKEKRNKFLILSISPYTFFATILFIFSSQKPFVYLRSDGYQEYKSIFGFYGPIIYGFMFNIVSRIASFISCREHILRNKIGKVVSPSELTNNWMINRKPISREKIKLLYVGRLKIEKGIFSFVELFEENDQNIHLTIAGSTKETIGKIKKKNIRVLEIINNQKDLINLYDDHSIFILPSYTEGHPMVVLESLSRFRPIIIFKDIEHIIGDKKGIFVAERNRESIFKTINYIKNNYETIQSEMKENQLPTKETFLKQLKTLISN